MTVRFMDVFTEWASTYDETVTGHDPEYKEVFRRYDEILDTVADKAQSPVIEFGAGTGNLTQRLLARHDAVLAVEPSPEMRAILTEKIPSLDVQDGHFLSFEAKEARSFVSTYAFHHLTDEEKGEAIDLMASHLPADGKIVYADTMFVSEEARLQTIREARAQGFDALAEDLEREFYPLIPVMEELFTSRGFTVKFIQYNHFVWLVEAEKMGE
ncbi:SAM-dependent methyltransferase [Exiguobacterium sp. KKBO11]|uniref:class I SAM-dependent methyltransferase n=1 Tax=unclassified Exiguobacterium TaxID=2644629 RepID=UPI0007D78725|nr:MULTISPECIES: class I SAM-dependent methyltransferase [unclassified Exiguobacterium]OAI88989.1 SAM-dependent methyltransferase [Exiguobacterium sp. KKBO11]